MSEDFSVSVTGKSRAQLELVIRLCLTEHTASAYRLGKRRPAEPAHLLYSQAAPDPTMIHVLQFVGWHEAGGLVPWVELPIPMDPDMLITIIWQWLEKHAKVADSGEGEYGGEFVWHVTDTGSILTINREWIFHGK